MTSSFRIPSRDLRKSPFGNVSALLFWALSAREYIYMRSLGRLHERFLIYIFLIRFHMFSMSLSHTQ